MVHDSGLAAYVPRGWFRTGFWVCVLIAVAAVIRRIYALWHPTNSGPAELRALDAQFASHAGLTLTHILPAVCFVLLTPFVIFRRTAGENSWADALLLPIGAVVGITAYAMSVFSIGGWIERSAVLLFNTLFLCCLFRAYWYGSDRLIHQRWMIRATAILLGIATTRPVMGLFFATSRLTNLKPSEFFGMAFWIGFSINTIGIEIWLRSRGSQNLVTSP